ncbi:protein PXR1 [Cucumis melo]|uniref:Protein PXR1 n=1 Tax=Cucumis melo TaxID=3656 RepID=A0A1S3AV24_CUCME|nr:protein PXR1 [Cucumis melo]
MGETSEEKHEGKVEKKEKKDKEKHGEGEDEEKKKKKKEKNPADKKDPTKLRQKLEKLEAKMQALAVKKEEILKLLHEAEQNPPPPS